MHRAPTDGRFVRSYWAEWDDTVNQLYNGRFRVNAPDTVLGRHHDREAVRGNGMLQIPIEELPKEIADAELHTELWGGHPGTANKRVTINGRSTYPLPTEHTENEHCTHAYPTLGLDRTDLVRAPNAIQFACDQGSTFWGHFIVDNAALRVVLSRDHDRIPDQNLETFDPTIEIESTDGERLRVGLQVAEQYRSRIDAVHFQGRYRGYDENGNGQFDDWHGFTKDRRPRAWLGSATSPPFEIEWDRSMLPAQHEVAVRAVVEFEAGGDDAPTDGSDAGESQLAYETAARDGLEVPAREDATVKLHPAEELPRPFWSRTDRIEHECRIDVDHSATDVDQAELHVVIWDGGAGTVSEPLTLNGEGVGLRTNAGHDVTYQRFEVDPSLLERGANRVSLRSDSDHHGLEVLYPGPAIVTRMIDPSDT